MKTTFYKTLASFALAFLLFLSACSANYCGDLIYDEPNETCVCPPGTEPDYEVDACVGPDILISWDGHTVPYRMDGGSADAGPSDGAVSSDSNMNDRDALMSVDVGMSPDASDASDAADFGQDAGPPPADAVARYPWNGLSTGSVHVPDDEPVVNHPLRPKFMWEETPDADHYQIQLTRECTTEGFNSCAFERVALDETTTETTFWPESSLRVSMTVPVGSRYFWRVRACSASDVCSEWTPVRYLDVGRDTHDYNGDGYGDVVVAASGASAPESGEGNVFVYFGSETGIQAEPDLTLDNPMDQIRGEFGAALGAAGDVNGDGFADLVVGAPKQDSPEQDEGVVYVFFGSLTGPVRPGVMFDSPADRVGAEFGASIAGGADVNGDGYTDIVVGAPSQGFPERDEGNAFVFLGRRAGPSEIPNTVLHSPRGMGVRFGSPVTLADLDGDGFAEVIAADVGYEMATGAVHVFAGGGTGIASDAAYTRINPRMEEEGGFGYQPSTADFDSDGFMDLMVGVVFEAVPEIEKLGPFVYHGTLEGLSELPALEYRSPLFEPLGFGSGLSEIGDVDGDGFVDAMICAPFTSTTTTDYVGTCYVYAGTRDGLSLEPRVVMQHPDSENGAAFGFAVGEGRDINGDGYSDFVVGASGTAHIIFGTPGSIPRAPSVSLADPTDRTFGIVVL